MAPSRDSWALFNSNFSSEYLSSSVPGRGSRCTLDTRSQQCAQILGALLCCGRVSLMFMTIHERRTTCTSTNTNTPLASLTFGQAFTESVVRPVRGSTVSDQHGHRIQRRRPGRSKPDTRARLRRQGRRFASSFRRQNSIAHRWRVCIYHSTKGLRCDTPCSSGSVFIAKTGFVKPVTLVTVQESLCSPSQWQWCQLFELIDRGISLFTGYLRWAGMAATFGGGIGAERIGDTKVSKRDRPRSVSPTRVPFRLREQLCRICTRCICCGQSRDFGARRSVGKNAGITRFDVEHRYSLECQRRSSVDRELQGAGMGARDKLETTRRRSSEGDCRARQQRNDRTDEIGAKH